MPSIAAIVVCCLLLPPLAKPDDGQARAPSDSERAMQLVVANRALFWPAGVDTRRFDDLQVEVRLLGEALTADGPRKLAVVRVRTRAADGQWPQELFAGWVVYFSQDMKLLEHHNHGCGSDLRLEGSVLHYGPGRSFDLSTPEGLAAFKATQSWC
jgi:hypothetical protein